jgi:ArsR family transcriptional regulator
MSLHIDVTLEAILQEHALVFKALSDPTRLKILSLLIEANGTLDVTGLVDRLDSFAQPTVSYHLRLLTEAGLIEPNKQGMHIFYQVLPDRLEEALKMIAHLLDRQRWLEA